MQATTFRLGALVALVGALPAPLDDASDIARLTIKKHKKHHSLEPSMHEAFHRGSKNQFAKMGGRGSRERLAGLAVFGGAVRPLPRPKADPSTALTAETPLTGPR